MLTAKKCTPICQLVFTFNTKKIFNQVQITNNLKKSIMEKKIQRVLSELDCEAFQKDKDMFFDEIFDYIIKNYSEEEVAEKLRYYPNLMVIGLDTMNEKYIARDFLKDRLGYSATKINKVLTM